MSVGAGPGMSNRAIYSAALEFTEPALRQAYLDEVCGNDVARRVQIEQLLAAREIAQTNPLDKVIQQLGPEDTLASEPSGGKRSSFSPPPIIDRYKIREQIGEGGMGVVYVAEQTHPVRRKVALKIIKPGMNSQDVIARFEAERQALAMMDHPNIARVLDAATMDDGRPYFVMELVMGVPITEFCDDNKLTNRARLELFIDVCSAVQHAHQKGIIHRDLKPSNIMVTMNDDKPMPKVIDFGIAKALSQPLTEHSIYTAYGQVVGTPVYMSPEQAQLSATDVDTRSDVYSLGVLLYELLTGSTPFDKETLQKSGFDEMRRVIREVDPPRPSQRVSTLKAQALSTVSGRRRVDPRVLSRSLAGELDWIVMRALEKDRDRRYEAASVMAQDIQRYLNDEPVQACPPSIAYRFRKYAKRHKGLLTTAAVLVVTLLIATGISVGYAMQAEQEKDKAVVAQQLADQRLTESQQSFAHALQAVDQMLTRVGDERLNDIPQMQTVQAELLQDAVKFYQALLEQHPGTPIVRYRMAVAQGSLGNVESLLGRTPDAVALFRAAITTLDDLVKQFPGEPEYQSALAGAYNDLGWHLGDGRDNSFRNAATLYERLACNYPQELSYRWNLAHSYQSIAMQLKRQGQLVEAQAFARRAVDLFPIAESGGAEIRGAAYLALAEIQQQQGLPEQADMAYVDAIHFRREFLLDAPLHAKEQHFLADMLFKHGILLQTLNRNEQAASCYREAADIWQLLADSYPNAAWYGNSRSSAQRSLTKLLIDSGQADKAIAELGKRIAVDPDNSRLYRDRGEVLRNLGRHEEAVSDFNLAIEFISPNGDPQPYVSRGELFLTMNQVDQAMADFREAFASAGHSPNLVNQLSIISRKLSEDRQYKDALAVAQLALEHASGESLVHVALCEANLGLQRYDEALAHINQAIDRDKAGGWWLFKRRAEANFGLNQFEAALADLNTALERHSDDLSTVGWIPAEDIANCPSAKFREGVQELSNRAVKLNNESPASRIARATLRAGLGDLEQAREELLLVLAADNLQHYSLYQIALLSLQLADPNHYKSSCEKMLAAFADSDVPIETHFAAWTCALAPEAIADYAPAIQLARHAVDKEPHNQQYRTGLGAILMRSGQYDEARTELENALAEHGSQDTSASYVRYFLAMTEHKLGNQQIAKDQLETANKAAEEELAGSPAWNRKLTLKLLRHESETLIGNAADSLGNDANSPDTHPAPPPE